jgi:hypothetical protein
LAFSSDSPRWSLGGIEGLTRTACFRYQVRSALWSSLASCTRDWMLSFAKTERRCVPTVLTDMASSVEADLLVCPVPMSRATRRSAGVSAVQPVLAWVVVDHFVRRAPCTASKLVVRCLTWC